MSDQIKALTKAGFAVVAEFNAQLPYHDGRVTVYIREFGTEKVLGFGAADDLDLAARAATIAASINIPSVQPGSI